ncbi:MAG TPA: hypothetical protein VK939_03010 [Longimicrobiales bacterium]|nr:hypothetical protein [Longimicrobiales bacterium]
MTRAVAGRQPARYTLRLRTTLAALLLATSAACAPPAFDAGLPVDSALVAEARGATEPRQPLHVTFEWSLQDPDGRFSGQGVVRIEPPWRARLDLFGPRGEGYLIAILQDEQLRLPPGAPAAVLPPPAFLWAVLGAFREPDGARLEAAHRSGTDVLLGYSNEREQWRFRLSDERLRHVEWLGPDRGRRTVELGGEAAHGLPGRGVYRDWLAFRELTLSVRTVEQVDGFPADIWYLDGR